MKPLRHCLNFRVTLDEYTLRVDHKFAGPQQPVLRDVTEQQQPAKTLLSTFALLMGIVLLGIAPVHAQLKTKVVVEPSKPKAMLYTTSIGVAADRWDAKAFDPATVTLLQDAGITSLRFPGNGGTDALYHWSNNTITNPYTSEKVPVFPPERQFHAVSAVIDKLGTGLITVNYGSNLDGSGGGEPAEAAAWVAYVNGKPSNTQAIGKDSKGNDWKTVGYWATLRASDPLATDDGLNHLRLGHSDPFGILLWSIGYEPYYNGFYGQNHTVGSDFDNAGLYGQSGSPEPDLHAGQVPTAKDWGKHTGNGKVGPQAYGAAVVEYAKAMKAVDPTILVGASLTLPPISNDPNPVGKNWNAAVLKAACASMDFSAISLVEGKESVQDTGRLDESDLLKAERYPMDSQKHYNMDAIDNDFALLAGDLAEKYKKFCPAGHAPQVAITNLGVSSWLPARNPSVVGLFAADAMAMLLQTGAYTVEWSPIHGASPTFLDNNNQPQPAYYGIKLLHQVIRPGDVFVTASTPLDEMRVYAVKRRDGGLGLLLINRSPDRSITTTVSVEGYNYARTGTRYDWGKSAVDAGKGIAEAPIENLGASFNVEVPRYSITAIVIPKAQ